MDRAALIRFTALTWLLASAPPAAAQSLRSPPDIAEVTLRGCHEGATGAAVLLATLDVELQQSGLLRALDAADSESGALAQVELTLECHAQRVDARAVDVASGTAVLREIPLVDVEAADRVRVVALAVTELVGSLGFRSAAHTRAAAEAEARSVASRANAQTADRSAARSDVGAPRRRNPSLRASQQAPLPARAPVEQADQPDPQHARWPIAPAVAVRVRWFPGEASAHWGGSAGVERGRFRVEVEALGSRAGHPLGSATVGLSAVSAGYSLIRAGASWAMLNVGAAAAAGATWALAQSARESVRSRTVVAPYTDIRGFVRVDVPISNTCAQLELNGGHGFGMTARAENQVLATTGGWFFGAASGVRW